MKKNNLILIIIAIGLLTMIFGIVFLAVNNQPARLDGFAQCLKDKGAVFYGAFWCSHCQNQKTMFGRSQKLLPYIECSTSDGRGQLNTCKDKNIEGYPTWIFSNGERLSGEISLETLSEKTGCELPN
ncbi:MAG: thioredoxin domain-containing protein [Patescibacteria group bacterium]